MHQFTSFLEPTFNTRKISNNISKISKSKLHTIKLVNDYVNKNIRYRRDIKGYGKVEFFASPDRTLKNGWGDCEDLSSLEIAILNGVTKNRPDKVQWAFGYRSTFFGEPISYHSWVEVNIKLHSKGDKRKLVSKWYIIETTNRKIYDKSKSTYVTLLIVHPTHISIRRTF